MSKIENIDKNFIIQTDIDGTVVKEYDARLAPFSIHGVTYKDGCFRRMPQEIARKVSEGVLLLSTHNAGGRVRFRTDSPFVRLRAKYYELNRMSHFAFTGCIGFDLYADNQHQNTFIPNVNITDTLAGVINLGERKFRDITINFPLYSSISDLKIGLSEDATVEPAPPYCNEKPIVYYGSSITQGGCASRPGTSYQGFVSRELNADYINLGFSGNARAEDAMAEYISGLDMSIFVYDYDHNSPSIEHLEATHEKMFKRIREAHPDMPIIIMSRPKANRTAEENERLEIITTTYENARQNGDRNVYLIDGDQLTALCKDEGRVDGCHPTDFGFASMAAAVIKVIKDNCLLAKN